MTPTNRFFSVSPAVYEQVRAGLDAQWGHPNGRAETCMVPAAQAVQHGQNVIANVLREQSEWPEIAAFIAQLTEAGMATEITEAEYFALLPTTEL